MLLVVRFWEEFDENRDLARRIVVVFALVVFRRQNRRHSFTMCLRVLLRDQTRARKKSVIRSTMRDARGVMNIFLLFFLFFYFFVSFLASGNFFLPFDRSSIRCFQTKIKTTSECSLRSLSFFVLTNNSDECAKRKAVVYHRLIDFTRSCSLRACVRERAKERARVIQLF